MSLFSRQIGIDFGTYCIRIYKPEDGVVFNEASSISFSGGEKEKNIISFGEHSEEMKGRTPDSIMVEHIINRGTVQNQSHTEKYIKEALKYVNGFSNIFKYDAVINIPLSNSSMEVRSIFQACKNAGIREIYSDYSVLFAGLGSGSSKNDLTGKMVADIGAGTTEVAVISFGGINNSGYEKIGGIDLDQDIVDYTLERYKVHISKEIARQVKETVGSAIRSEKETSIDVTGNDTKKKLPKVIKLTSNDVQEATEETIRKIIKVIARVFRDTPPELTSDIINHGIVLTGGVAKMPGLAKIIEKSVNTPVTVASNPDLAVIYGIGKSIKSNHVSFHNKSLMSK